jgi:predicted ATPase
LPGRLDAAIDQLKRAIDSGLPKSALAEARRLSPFNLAFALFQAWYGDWALEGVKSAQTLLRSAEEVLVISGEQGFSEWFGIGNIMRGWCLAAVGQVAEGIPILLHGLATYRGTGAKLGYPFALTTLAEVHGMAAQPEEGLDRLDEAAKLIDTTQERWSEAELHRLRGTLLLSMREPTAAEDSFHHALAVARLKAPGCGNFAPPPASPASGKIKASGMRPEIFSLRSTAGSLKGSTRAI